MADFFGPVIQLFSNAMIPAVFALAIGFGLYKKIPVYEEFVEGGKEGFEMAVRIIPYWWQCWLPSACCAAVVPCICSNRRWLIRLVGWAYRSKYCQ